MTVQPNGDRTTNIAHRMGDVGWNKGLLIGGEFLAAPFEFDLELTLEHIDELVSFVAKVLPLLAGRILPELDGIVTGLPHFL